MSPSLARWLRLWLPVAAYMALIFHLSSQSQVSLPGDLSDKSWHVAGYIGLGLLAMRAVTGGVPARVTWRDALLGMAITVAYGVSDELHQRFVPGRSPDVLDVFADACGAAIAAGLAWACGILLVRSDV